MGESWSERSAGAGVLAGGHPMNECCVTVRRPFCAAIAALCSQVIRAPLAGFVLRHGG